MLSKKKQRELSEVVASTLARMGTTREQADWLLAHPEVVEWLFSGVSAYYNADQLRQKRRADYNGLKK